MMNYWTALFKYFFIFLAFSFSINFIKAQNVPEPLKNELKKIEQLRLNSNVPEALEIIEKGIRSAKNGDELAYLYTAQTRCYIYIDSLLPGKKASDLSLEYAAKTSNKEAKAVALISRAYVNNYISQPDEIIKDAMEGLKLLDNSNKDLSTKATFYYLLYAAYSSWNDVEKMEINIRESIKVSEQIKDANLLVNAYNGLSSTYLIKYEIDKSKIFLDSSLAFLQKSFNIYQDNPKNINGSSFVVTCTNIANHYLEYSDKNFAEKKAEAFRYLNLAEDFLTKENMDYAKLANIYGIKSRVAIQENDLPLAEINLQMALAGLNKQQSTNNSILYNLYKELTGLEVKKNNFTKALEYQQMAEETLMKLFDEQQRLNAQKLEIQYETEKRNKEVEVLKATAGLRRMQNYLYIGIAAALAVAMLFMFRSYHFKLRYSIAREKKLEQEREEASLLAKLKEEETRRTQVEKLEALQKAEMQMKLEKEEQARLKAEQKLLEMQQQQLKKEVMANALQIEHKNEMLHNLKDQINKGDAVNIKRIVNEEMILDEDFEKAKMKIQKLHPDFFNKLSKNAKQRLTDLDLKYCAYIHLKMNTKQIAQLLHVEPKSVRMSKYRIKQKLGLQKDEELDEYLRTIS